MKKRSRAVVTRVDALDDLRRYPPWTPFERCQFAAGGWWYGNSRYSICVRDRETPLGSVKWLSIHDHWRTSRHDWRDLQRIKNELVGPEYEAVEIYPPESSLVDTSNEYHLWVFVGDAPFSLIGEDVGLRDGRHVLERPDLIPGCDNARQRPWDGDSRPTDLSDCFYNAMGEATDLLLGGGLQ